MFALFLHRGQIFEVTQVQCNGDIVQYFLRDLLGKPAYFKYVRRLHIYVGLSICLGKPLKGEFYKEQIHAAPDPLGPAVHKVCRVRVEKCRQLLILPKHYFRSTR